MSNQQKGFSLVELMVAFVIVGILGSIALPAYQGLVGRAQIMEGLQLAEEVKLKVMNEYFFGGPAAIETFDQRYEYEAGTTKNTQKIEVRENTAEIRIFYKTNEIYGMNSGENMLVLRPNFVNFQTAANGASTREFVMKPVVLWICGVEGTTVPDALLPISCRDNQTSL